MKKRVMFCFLRSTGLLIIGLICCHSFAFAQYSASPSSTATGDGSFGSILRMTVNMSGTSGQFTVTKTDGSAFSTAGTIKLQVGTFESFGTVRSSQSVSAGTYSYSFTDNFAAVSGYPKDYYIRFENTSGGVAWVGPIRINCTPPSPPTLNAIGESAPGGTIRFDLSWNAVSGVSAYRLFRNGAQIYCAGGTSYTDSGAHLSANTNYSYYVIADSGNNCGGGSNGCGTSANSNTRTANWSVPAVPTGVTATSPTTNSITINWNAVSAATRYKVRRVDNGQETSDLFTISYLWTGLSSGQQFCFTVIACSDGCSASSSQACATTTSSTITVSNVSANPTTLTIGSAFTANWSCNAPAGDTVTISLKRDSYTGSTQGADYAVLSSTVTNSGSAGFTAPSGINSGNDWRLYVRHNTSNQYAASGLLTINPASAAIAERSYQIDSVLNGISNPVNTGISVTAGQSLNITASGQICLVGSYCVNAAGDTNGSSNGFRNGALLGRIGAAGAWFLVGTNYQQAAPASGLLYLAVNDSYYPDNSGEFAVIIGACSNPANKLPNPALTSPADQATGFGTVVGSKARVTLTWNLNSSTAIADAWLTIRDLVTQQLVFNQNVGAATSQQVDLELNRQYQWAIKAMPKSSANCVSDGVSKRFTTIVAATGFTIAGTVFDTNNTSGLSGVSICIAGPSANNCSTITPANGTFILGSVTALTPGAYTITPQKAGVIFSPSFRTVTLAAQNITGVNFYTDTTVPQINIVTPGSGASVSGDILFTGAAIISPTTLSLNRLVMSVNGTDVGKVEGSGFGNGFFGYQADLREVTWKTMAGAPLTTWTQILPVSGYAEVQIRAEGSNGKNGYSPKVQLQRGAALAVTITSPTAAEMPLLRNVAVTATSSVPACATSSCTYAWSINGNCPAGSDCTQPSFTFSAMSALAPGYLTLAVTDALGNVGSVRVTLAVDAPSQNGDPESLSQMSAGYGVNVANGNFFTQRIDMVLPGVGMPLAFTRAYNSNPKTGLAANAIPQPLGKGWTHSYNIKLIGAYGGDKIDIVWGDGMIDSWFKIEGEYRSAFNNFAILKQNGTDVQVITKEQMTYNFDASGRLYKIEDRQANFVELQYFADGRLQWIIHRAGTNGYGYGRFIGLEYCNGADCPVGLVKRAFDNAGRGINFGYDVNGYLATATDLRGKTESYGYVAKGTSRLLNTVRDKKNNLILTNSYDDYDPGIYAYRCVTQTDNANRSFTFDYTSTPNQTTARNSRGEQTRFVLDSSMRVVNVIDPQNYAAQTGYLATTTTPAYRGLAANVNDPLTRQTEFQYSTDNTRGNLQKVMEPSPNGDPSQRLIHQFGYLPDANINQNNRNLFNQYKDPEGNQTDITYNALDLPATTTYPATSGMSPLSYVYNSRGQITTATATKDGSPQVTQYQYGNSYFDQTRVISPLGFSTDSEYDGAGHVTKITDHFGKTVEFTYEGDLVKTRKVQIDAGRYATTTFTYDDNGRLIFTDAPLFDGNPANGHRTVNEYNALGLLTKMTNGAGEVTQYEYDELDRLIRTKFTNGGVNPIESTFDASGRLISRRNVNLNEMMSFSYDGNGNVLTETDSLGRKKTNEYDALDRVTRVRYDDGTDEVYTYTMLSKVATMRDRRGNTTSYTYDSLGRLKTTTEPVSAGTTVATTVSYDSVGNLKEIIDPRGKFIRFEYDNNNRLITRVEDATGSNLRFQYAYDAKDRLVTYTAPDGLTATYTYYDSDWLKSITYANGSGGSKRIDFEYNNNGHLTRMTDDANTASPLITNYQPDPLGRLLSRTDPFGNAIGYSYDTLGRLATITYPGNKQVTYGYDSANRMQTVTSWLGVMATYSYNAAGQLAQVVNGNGTTVSYEYQATTGRLTGMHNRKADGTVIASYQYTLDGNGNRTHVDTTQPLEAPPVPQSVSYAYDGANRLTTAGNKTYSFNNRGVLQSITAPGGNSTFTFDVLDRLVSLTAPGTTASFVYDGQGNRLSQTVNGTATRFVVDTNKGLPDVLLETNSVNAPQRYYIYGLGLIAQADTAGNNPRYYHYNGIGSTVALTDSSQNVTDAYAYDPFGGVLSQTGNTPNPFQFVGQYGVQQSVVGLQYMRERYYIPDVGQFSGRDDNWGSAVQGQILNLFAYSSNNPITNIDPSGLLSLNGVANWLEKYISPTAEKIALASSTISATCFTAAAVTAPAAVTGVGAAAPGGAAACGAGALGVSVIATGVSLIPNILKIGNGSLSPGGLVSSTTDVVGLLVGKGLLKLRGTITNQYAAEAFDQVGSIIWDLNKRALSKAGKTPAASEDTTRFVRNWRYILEYHWKISPGLSNTEFENVMLQYRSAYFPEFKKLYENVTSWYQNYVKGLTDRQRKIEDARRRLYEKYY